MSIPVIQSSILVINCGSSTVKFAVIAPESGQSLVSGMAEQLGTVLAELKVELANDQQVIPLPGADHEKAIECILSKLDQWLGAGIKVIAVGHRVVHGGEVFSKAARIDSKVIALIEQCRTLAPLHNSINLFGIRAVERARPDLPQVAVFDTAFHQTMPQQAYLYAIPYHLYESNGIRRYGFHGTSHQYVAQVAAAKMRAKFEDLGLITLHLGNGCSACAIEKGKSVDTTMGLSPLEGMAMGTRSGNVDPDLPRYLNEQLDMDLPQISNLLNRKSGLLGLSGSSNDMRVLLEMADSGDESARRAIDVFTYRAAQAAMGMAAGLESLHAIIFTGGIGENAAPVRAAIASRLRLLGLKISASRNCQAERGASSCISSDDSPIQSWVIPTNEELMIAQQTICTL